MRNIFLLLSTIKEDKVCDENKMDVMIKEILDLVKWKEENCKENPIELNISRAYSARIHI